MENLLIIEDDLDLQDGLAFSLQLEGYHVQIASSLAQGWAIIESQKIHLVVLDCNLPDGSGYHLCTRLKEVYPTLPILMLTARDTEMDEVKALELGVDEYMRKPFSLAVLKLRIKKLLLSQSAPTVLRSNGIHIDVTSGKVYKGTGEIACSRIEYQLLCLLVENKNTILSKAQILDKIWDSHGKFVDENTVSVNIKRLRDKIEDHPKEPQWIHTVRGLGYMWREEEG